MSVKILAAILTISDSRDEKTDVSGAKLVELLSDFDVEIVEKIIVTDDFDDIRQTLFALTTRDDLNLIVTTGGTGFSERDNTPEATRAVIERETPGLSEAMRRETSRFNPKAILSRGVCGIRNRKLIINLPGSPRAVAECFEVLKPVLQHAIELIEGKTGH